MLLLCLLSHGVCRCLRRLIFALDGNGIFSGLSRRIGLDGVLQVSLPWPLRLQVYGNPVRLVLKFQLDVAALRESDRYGSLSLVWTYSMFWLHRNQAGLRLLYD